MPEDDDHEDFDYQRQLYVGDFVDLLRIVWPRPVLFGDYATFHHQREYWDSWIKACNGDLTLAERGSNHVHLGEVLYPANECAALSTADWQLVLKLYRTLLKAELDRVLQGRPYEIHVFDEDKISVDPHECEITFNLVRPPCEPMQQSDSP